MAREACFLPAYFAVNEIDKLSVEADNGPHWVGLMCMYLIVHLCRDYFVLIASVASLQ